MANDIVLITGASSGIGEALARRVAQSGRSVALVARRADRLEALAAELRRDHGIEAQALPCDLTKPGAIAALAREVEQRGLTVDWLVNNAGFGTVGRFYKLPVERELEELRLNVGVLMELTRRFMPGMVQRGRGAVMNIASMAAFSPGPYMATYCATKAFVLSFTESIADEVKGTGVHVLCVCPGFTRTEFQQKAHVDTTAMPNFVWMSAEDVADQAVRAVGHGPVLVNGRMNSLTTVLTRFVPRGLLTRAIGGFLKPKEA